MIISDTLFVTIAFILQLVADSCKGQDFVPEISEECKEKGYCESVPNYPTEAVEKILSELGDEGIKKFQMDSLDNPEEAGRHGGHPMNIELCDSQPKIIYPLALPDKDGRWYTLVNRKENPVQSFRVELCGTSTCSAIVVVPTGRKATCRQKYIYKYVDVVDTDGSHVLIPLRVPSCCSCVTNLI